MVRMTPFPSAGRTPRSAQCIVCWACQVVIATMAAAITSYASARSLFTHDTHTLAENEESEGFAQSMTESLLNGVAGGGRKLPRVWPFVVAFVIVCATLITCAVLNMISLSSHSANRCACERAVLTLVQSIPVVDFDIQPAADSMPTHDAFIALADASIASLDFTAMYMDLNASADQDQFSHAELATLGAGRGAAVLDALFRAAQRGVSIRILLGTLNNPINSTEVRSLLRYPNVAARIYDPRKWYGGGGIMHLKLWHSDATRAYLGCANADWKSLAQVKEVGVLINTTRSGGATADLGRLYEVFWAWSDPALIPEACAPSQSHTSPTSPCHRGIPLYRRACAIRRWRHSPCNPIRPSLHSRASNMQPLCLSGSSDANPSANLHVAEGDAHAFVSASPGGAGRRGARQTSMRSSTLSVPRRERCR